MTFVQCGTNVEDVIDMLYKCYVFVGIPFKAKCLYCRCSGPYGDVPETFLFQPVIYSISKLSTWYCDWRSHGGKFTCSNHVLWLRGTSHTTKRKWEHNMLCLTPVGVRLMRLNILMFHRTRIGKCEQSVRSFHTLMSWTPWYQHNATEPMLRTNIIGGLMKSTTFLENRTLLIYFWMCIKNTNIPVSNSIHALRRVIEILSCLRNELHNAPSIKLICLFLELAKHTRALEVKLELSQQTNKSLAKHSVEQTCIVINHNHLYIKGSHITYNSPPLLSYISYS